MVIDGDFTVGTGSGGLSVSGTIASTGSYFQIGSAGSGAMRLAKTSPGVFSVQSYNGTTWLLGTLNSAIIFTDLINSATAGGIFVGDHLRLYSGSAAVKLYDSTNSAPANYYLSTNSSGYPVWVPASSFAWNGGTVTNNLTISKTQPYIDFYYGGVREWKVGMLDSGSATFSIIEQAGSKGLNIDGNGLITVFGNVTSQGYLQTTLNSQVLPATTNGMCMLWNFTGGHAEADFFNTYELSNASDYGGFRWYQKLTSTTYLQLASIDTVGNLRIAGCYWLGTIAGLYRYGGNSTVVGGGDNGYFNDDGSVTLGKSDYTKTVAVRGYLFPTEIRSGSGGNLGIDDNQLWAGNAQAADGVELYFNYNSYLKGASYFRDVVVCNGKGGRVAILPPLPLQTTKSR
jgi:hypothetical protein